MAVSMQNSSHKVILSIQFIKEKFSVIQKKNVILSPNWLDINALLTVNFLSIVDHKYQVDFSPYEA